MILDSMRRKLKSEARQDRAFNLRRAQAFEREKMKRKIQQEQKKMAIFSDLKRAVENERGIRKREEFIINDTVTQKILQSREIPHPTYQ